MFRVFYGGNVPKHFHPIFPEKPDRQLLGGVGQEGHGGREAQNAISLNSFVCFEQCTVKNQTILLLNMSGIVLGSALTGESFMERLVS